MRILQVIHGFPPYYMAGSEVYAYTVSKEFNKNHEVYVFSRIENPFIKDYELIEEVYDGIPVYRVNKPRGDYSLRDKYLDENIDRVYSEVVKRVDPDIVHIHHLSHLSTNIPLITKEIFKKPIIFTIHDFWMFCVRGQLLTPEYRICGGPSIERCTNCLSYLYTRKEEVREFQKHMRKVLESIDLFLSPSHTLRNFYIRMGISPSKVIYSPYGLDKDKIKYRKKVYRQGDPLVFGFVGRVIPPKGVHLLIKAFSTIKNKNGSVLKIYGEAGKLQRYLEKMGDEGVSFMGGFDNREIDKVLENIDVLVVPSIWYENSPLVIQEAFLKGIPVITSNIGGMKELVRPGIDGFLFEMGDELSLRRILEKIIENPEILNSLSVNRDWLRSIEDDVSNIVNLFRRFVK